MRPLAEPAGPALDGLPWPEGDADHRFLGPEGPVPTVEVHTSFNDERPVVTSVQFFWPGRRAPGGTTSGT